VRLNVGDPNFEDTEQKITNHTDKFLENPGFSHFSNVVNVNITRFLIWLIVFIIDLNSVIVLSRVS
jgi:hypothetical protein